MYFQWVPEDKTAKNRVHLNVRVAGPGSARGGAREADRLAGASEQARASLHAALGIYKGRRATPLADQAAATLASLTAHPAPSRPSRPSGARK